MKNFNLKLLSQICFIFLHWTWGILQTFVGFFVFILTPNCRYIYLNGSLITEIKGNWGGISLGMFVFVDRMSDGDKAYEDDIVRHEYGHTLQSILLGPLYFIVVGIPSIIWATFFGKWRKKHNKSYYWLYCEAWANKWGGVNDNK